MRYTTEIQDGVRVVALHGNFTGGPDADSLRGAFGGWLEHGERCFVVDMAGVELLNSIGLGTLVASYSTCSRHGGVVKLSGLSERNRRAAYISRILDMFEEFDESNQAVSSFARRADA